MKKSLMTITESQYGAERDLDGPLEPKYQEMQDRIFAGYAARMAAAAMLNVVLTGTPDEVAAYATSETCAKMRQATVAGIYGEALKEAAKNILEAKA